MLHATRMQGTCALTQPLMHACIRPSVRPCMHACRVCIEYSPPELPQEDKSQQREEPPAIPAAGLAARKRVELHEFVSAAFAAAVAATATAAVAASPYSCDPVPAFFVLRGPFSSLSTFFFICFSLPDFSSFALFVYFLVTFFVCILPLYLLCVPFVCIRFLFKNHFYLFTSYFCVVKLLDWGPRFRCIYSPGVPTLTHAHFKK